MATELRLRRGTTDEHSNFIGAEAEATVDTDKNTIVVHDGQTQGGFPLAQEADTAPAVDSVSTLRASSLPANLERLWLSGYYGVGTAGGGPLYRDSSDTTTADNGGTVFVDADGVRWKRDLTVSHLNNYVPVELFGAVGDGSTDDTQAIQAALDAALPISFGWSEYIISGNLNVSNRAQVIVGKGQATSIKQTADNTDVFVLVDGVSSGVYIADILITGTGDFSAGGVGVRSEYAGDLRFVRISVNNLFHAFYIDTRTNVSTSDIWLFQCKGFDTTSDTFRFNNCTQLYAIKCDAMSPGGDGFSITDGSAYHLTDCLVLSPAAHGVSIGGTQVDWVWLNQVECDNAGENGYQFSNCRGLFASNSWAGSCGGEGWSFLGGCKDHYFTNCTARSNDNHGFTIDELVGGEFNGCSAYENNADTATARAGFSVQTGAEDITFSACDATSPDTNRQQYGFEIAGSSTGIKVLGGRAKGNGSQQVRNTSTGQVTIRDVNGYVTENRGEVTATNSAPTPTVNHGLDTTPDHIDLQPLSDDEGLRWWVASINDTSFQVVVNVSPTNDVNFSWKATAEN